MGKERTGAGVLRFLVGFFDDGSLMSWRVFELWTVMGIVSLRGLCEFVAFPLHSSQSVASSFLASSYLVFSQRKLPLSNLSSRGPPRTPSAKPSSF